MQALASAMQRHLDSASQRLHEEAKNQSNFQNQNKLSLACSMQAMASAMQRHLHSASQRLHQQANDNCLLKKALTVTDLKAF